MNLLDIKPYFNNRGIAEKHVSYEEGFSLGKGVYPEEYLPKVGGLFSVDQIDFKFPARNEKKFDNLAMDNQSIPFTSSSIHSIYLLGASANGSFSEPVTVKRKGQEICVFKLKFSDFITKQMKFSGERLILECPVLRYANIDVDYYRPKIFLHTEKFQVPIQADEIVLGDNPFIHIFSITLGEENSHDT
ncbi:hypothetical protein [Bacillus mojavensis]|uniref:hypothetical protein n=1 Tax=Bacillus mojavensis TaxID=72360 RepID=UPI002DBC7FF5|nr:hypothetical protein [Bacillus mojavensis]MEC1686930.1 hypothetical protein [Bacillus mojavensis]